MKGAAPGTRWLLSGAALALASCAGGSTSLSSLAPLPGRPASCTDVPPGTPLQAAIDAAPAGGVLCLPSGIHAGPVRIDRGITVWGPPEAVIRSPGRDTTVRLEGSGARLLGLSVEGSGQRFDMLDAAVHLTGEHHVVEGVRVSGAIFGITSERAHGVVIRGNDVTGSDAEALGLRGDGIRLWETHGSIVENNRVRHGRDVVVWYSSDNRVSGNDISGSRYGTHLMYSHRNQLVGNRYTSDVVGVFVMYSRDVLLQDNLMLNAAGAAGVGLGVKESGNLTVRGNRFVHDTVGIYLDTSPLQREDANLFEGNELRLSRAGVVFHSSQHRNTFRGNTFKDNAVQVQVEGGGDALDVTWEGNDFDDYAGYDLDGDGVGDVPYQLRSLSASLVEEQPQLAFLHGSPALALVNVASEVLPLLAPRPILEDRTPRLGGIR